MSDTTQANPPASSATEDESVTEAAAGSPDPVVATDERPEKRELSEQEAAELEGMQVDSRSFARQTWDRFRRHKLGLFSIVMLVLVTLSFYLVPPLFGLDALAQDTSNTLADPSTAEFPRLLLGTDQLGRSIFVRSLVGGQFSIQIALVVSLGTTILGTLIGAVAGYFGGWIDSVLSQAINLFLIVPLLVVLLIVAKRFNSPLAISLLLAAFLWPPLARIVRGLFLQYREQEFVLAAKASGAGSARIMFRHIIPNVFGPIIVNTTLLIGTAIILESTLSFLGVGVTPPTPTLGNLVSEAKGFVVSKPHMVLGPGAFIVVISLCINFLGDAMRDALDPTTRD